MESLKRVAILVFLWVASVAITISNINMNKDYDERGIEVTATITEVIPRVRNRKDYVCTYYNVQGEKVTASLTLNQLNGEVGQVVVGKYLPESPGLVYCEASPALMYGVLGFFYLLTILYTIAFFSGGLNNDDDDEIAMIYEKYNVSPPRVVEDDFFDVRQQPDGENNEQWVNTAAYVDDDAEKQSSTGLKLKL